MSSETLKHFIFIRFFTFNDPKYPHDIYDVDFLSKQLPLTKNALGSLENQTNENFELIFALHPNFFVDPKYEFIFSTLKDSTTLPIKFMKNVGGSHLFTPKLNREVASLIEDSIKEYDFVITSRIDFDDFIYKGAVEDIQSKINECDDVLAYGYSKGYEYSCGELYPFLRLWSGMGHQGILQSLILKSSFAKEMPCFTVENFNHHILKNELKKFLEDNGVKFLEKMFQQNSSTNAVIYFRHNFAWTVSIRKNVLEDLSKQQHLTTANITKKQLEDEFGFKLELNSIE